MGDFELPKNKPSFNGKYKTKDALQSAIYNLLQQENVEGKYHDDDWKGIKKLESILSNNGIKHELLDANFEGRKEGSSLPTKKVYRFQLDARDKEGKNIPMFFKVTCAFIGKTGTMADQDYELTYYFF